MRVPVNGTTVLVVDLRSSQESVVPPLNIVTLPYNLI